MLTVLVADEWGNEANTLSISNDPIKGASKSASTDLDSPADLIDHAFEAIDQALEQLSLVANAIHRASRTTEEHRARRHIDAYDPYELDLFEVTSYSALRRLYPNAVESLLVQIAESMVNRYAVLRYRADRYFQTGFSSKRRIEDTHSAQADTIPKLPESSVSGNDTNVKTAGRRTVKIALPPASIDSAKFREQMARPRMPNSRAGSTVKLSGICEPSVPLKSLEDLHQTRCPWCFRVLRQAYFKEIDGKIEWSHIGRYAILLNSYASF